MMKRLTLVLALGACTTPTTDPQLVVDPGPWFVGETNPVSVEWPGLVTCDSTGWNCDSDPPPDFSLTNVTCDGCTASGVELHQTVQNADSFRFTATSTDSITIEVELSGGRTLSATGLGDRELRLDAQCKVIFTSRLDDSELSDSDFRDCDATRRANETVVIFPKIQTVHGSDRFPFCPDGAFCSPAYPRKTSQIVAVPSPDHWMFDDGLIYTTPNALAVTLQAPLADGTLSTATAKIPPVAN